jgi:hypothetical protein
MKLRAGLPPESTWRQRILIALHDIGPATQRDVAEWIGGDKYEPAIADAVVAEFRRMIKSRELYRFSGSSDPTGSGRPRKSRLWWITEFAPPPVRK